MKKYDNYKDSGEEWLGEMPSHWNLSSIKFLAKIQNGSTPSSSNDEYWNGDVNWVTTDDLGKLVNKEITETRRTITKLGYDSCGTSLAPIDSIVMSTRAPIGHIGILKIEASTNQGCKTIIPLKVNSLFCYYYFLNSKEVLQSLGQGSTFKELPTSTLKDFKIVFPSSIEEQTTIANYLDHKTSQIDHLIAKKEQFIKLLEEERVAVINQAVTKGLDPNVPMKDSGVEWLGEIPEHWEVVKFNLFVSIRHGHQFMNNDFTDDGIKIIKITQLHKDGFLDLSKCSFVSSSQLVNYQNILIKEKDILMCLTGGTIGKIIRVGKVEEPLLQNYRVGHFSSAVPSRITDDFIFWLMSSESIISQIFFQMRETGQPNIGMDDFGRMRITLPTLIEQEKIVQHIQKKTNEISDISLKAKQEIELLKEYKTALISEVVTGKVDVSTSSTQV
jgi:type I restriction enzyme S subunit